MALSPERQMELVYRQMARTAGFRGFRPRFLYTTAIASVFFTCLIVVLSLRLDLVGVAIGWCGGALVILVLAIGTVIAPAFRSPSVLERETVRAVVLALLPSLSVGAVVTGSILLRFTEAMKFLPCIWLVLFGLAISAIGPLIFAPMEYVVAAYIVAGGIAFLLRSASPTAFALLVGVPFSALHYATGRILTSVHTKESPHEQRTI